MPGPKKRTWIVVADAARARICRAGGSVEGRGLLEHAAFDDPDGHGHARDLGADRPGRSIESVGGARHALEPRADPHRRAKYVFARRIAAPLDRAAGDRAFDRPVLVAPAKMVGDLRATLGHAARRRVAREIDRDLTRLPADELQAQLREMVGSESSRRRPGARRNAKARASGP